MPALLGIAVIVAAIAFAFAWTVGWLQPDRLTPAKFTDALEQSNGKVYPGYRRAHTKGICVSGRFTSSGAGAALSRAAVLAPGAQSPVIGRLSIGGGMPEAPDSKGRVRSLALQLTDADGHVWRTAMNSFPVFMVRDGAGFFELAHAQTPDPKTGKPDPAAIEAFGKAHPEAKPFFAWAGSAPWPTSFANTAYNGVNSFYLVNAGGERQAVRWSFVPKVAVEHLTPEQLQTLPPDFLNDDLQKRLAAGPLSWDWVATLAEPGDAVDDPTVTWPEGRRQIVLGTLALDRSEAQTTGACRDINFDPLILPAGVEGSGDKVLAARSAVYSSSFNRRLSEIGHGQAPEATGQKPATTPGAQP